jgi:hypothetical protein
VNGILEGVVPLDVDVDATKAEKMAALERVVETLVEDAGPDWVFTASWRDEEATDA